MVEIILYIAGGLILMGMLTALWRFVKGPSSADRIMSFDVMTVTSIALIALGVAAWRPSRGPTLPTGGSSPWTGCRGR